MDAIHHAAVRSLRRCGVARTAARTYVSFGPVPTLNWHHHGAVGGHLEPRHDCGIGHPSCMGGYCGGLALGVCTSSRPDRLQKRHPSLSLGLAPYSLYVDGQFVDVWRFGHHAICVDEPQRTPGRLCVGGSFGRDLGVFGCGGGDTNHTDGWFSAGYRRLPRRQTPPRGGFALRHALGGFDSRQYLAECFAGQLFTGPPDSSGARLRGVGDFHQPYFTVETRSAGCQAWRSPAQWFFPQLESFYCRAAYEAFFVDGGFGLCCIQHARHRP